MNEYDDLIDQPVAGNEYDALIQQDNQFQRTQRRLSLHEALKVNPDQYAQSAQLAAQTKIPAPVVDRNQQAVDRQAKLNEYDRLLEKSPLLDQQMRDPELAKVAHDDIDNLSLIEQAIVRGFRIGEKVVPPLKRARGALLAAPSSASAAAAGVFTSGFNFLSEYLGQPAVQSGLLPEDPFARGRDTFQDMRRNAQMMTDALQGDLSGTGETERAVYSGLQSFGQMLPGLIASVLTGNPAPMLAWGSTMAGGESSGTATEAGVPAASSVLYGLSDAAIEYGTEMLPALKLLGDLKVGSSLFKTLVNQVATEVPQEQLATVLQDLNQWATLNPDAPFSDYIDNRASAAYQTLVATLTGVGAQTAAAYGTARLFGTFAQDGQKAREAEAAKAQLDQYGKLAANSELARRSHEKFQQVVEGMLADNKDAELYVDAGEFTEYFQSQGEDPGKVATDLGLGEQYQEALIRQGDVRIPAGQYLSKLYPFTGLNEIVRTSPDAMSAKEAKTWTETQGEAFQAEAERVLAANQQDESFQASADAVQTAIRDQIVATGRFTEDTADKYASLHRAFAVAMADRLGINPSDVYARFGLQVRGGLQDMGGVAFDQSAPQPNAHYTKLAAQLRNAGMVLGKESTETGLAATEFTANFLRSQSSLQQFLDTVKVQLDSLSLGQTSKVVDGDSATVERLLDGVKANTKTLRDILSSKTFAEKGFGGLNIKTQRRMLAAVAGLIHNPKILDSIVSLVPVDVVNDLGGKQRTADVLLNNFPVFEPSDSVGTGDNVPVLDAASPTKRKEARLVAKMSPSEALASYLESVIGDGLGEAAIGTINNRHGATSNSAVLGAEGAGTPSSPTTLLQGEKPSKPRAKIQFPADLAQGPSIITLMEDADLSGFLHESGHFYLEVLRNLASQPNAPQSIQDDLSTLMAWFKEQSPDWTGEIGTEQHEQFARGFEAYLFEGTAPSLDMKSVFETFRSWLVAVYRNLRALNVTLTDEVRQVMDGMLATQQQIRDAEIASQYTPLFESAEQAGMTPEEWRAYQAVSREASGQADAELAQKTLANIKWLSGAKSRILKALQKDAAGKRKAVKAEVADALYREPVYAARRFLTHGELDGKAIQGSKLSLPILKAMYPGGEYKALPVGKYGMVANEGMHPDIVADLFGFGSGDELVRRLLDAPKPQDVIEQRTDQTMLQRYGDIANQAELERAANAAIHNKARIKFVATELRQLNKRLGNRNILASAAKEYADKAISRMKVRDIRPGQYAAAAARAGREAEKALKAGDQAASATHKRAQLLNMYFVRSATKALEEVGRSVRYLNKFNNPGTRKALDPDYRDQIDALLERFDLRAASLKAIDKRKSLAAWIKSQEDQGLQPIIDEALLADTQKRHYKDIPLEELRGLRDTVKNIEHIARFKKKLLTIQSERELDAIKDELVESIDGNSKGPRKQDIETHLPKDKALRGLRGFFAEHRKLADLARQFDGWKDGGAFWRYFIRPLNERSDMETARKAEANLALNDLFQPLTERGKLYQKESIPEINMSLTKMGRIMVALNMGNEANFDRILKGYNWTPQQIEAIVDSLTQEDWNFVQGIWDYIDTYWDDIAAKERRVTGVVPKKVQARPVATKYGEYRGGYFPIKYDYSQNPKAYADTAKEAADSAMKGLYSRATTRRGHTIERLREVKRPVRLDFGVIFEHVEGVIHDLAMHEWLIDANRILGSHRVQEAIIRNYGNEVLQTMQADVAGIAGGNILSVKGTERALNWLRSGVSIAYMGWNLMTSAIQPMGLTQSVARIGAKWVGRGIQQWVGDAVHMENTAKWIYENSTFMRLRGLTLQREVSEIRSRVMKDSRMQDFLDRIARSMGKQRAFDMADTYFWLIVKAQLIADIPTWLGQYQKSMGTHGDESQAFAEADQAVLDSQGGGQVKDLAEVQQGSPIWKLFTNFYSYFNVTWNRNVEAIRKADIKNPKSIGRMAVDLMWVNVMPSVMMTILYEALRGGCHGDLECVAKQAAKDQVGYVLNQLVGVRELGSVVSGYDYAGPAGLRFFAEATKLYKQAEQGEPDAAFIKSLNRTSGILFHYPAAQVERTASGLYALGTGEARNPEAILFGPQSRR